MRFLTKPIVSLAFLAAFTLQNAQAQDPRFSQFYNSPWNLSPAMTGVFNGQWRLTGNFRDQWNSFLSPDPYRTFGAAFDMRLPVGRSDYFAVGIGALHDEAGTAQFKQNRGHIGGSFIKQLSGGPRAAASHFISAGAQMGLGQNSMDWRGLWFSNQFDASSETPNTTLDSHEQTQNGATGTYLDFNAGLAWYALFQNEGYIVAGASLNHLNNPQISFLDDGSVTLPTRWLVHAAGQLPLNDNFYLLPAFQIMGQGAALEADPGLSVRYTNHDRNELALRAGIFPRITKKLDKGMHIDALAVLAMVELNRLSVGLSYDVTTSVLTQANNSRGAVELSIQYFGLEHRRGKVVCPKL